MNKEKLQSIIKNHQGWLRGADEGRANLSGANLSGADLYGANLSGASLSGANLSGANLYGADLSGADLYGANLYGADLSGANLSGADLSGANLYGASLYGAALSGAALSCQIPQDGQLAVWKSGYNGVLIKLLIPPRAKRTATLTGRKCRAEYAKVLQILDHQGEKIEEARGRHDQSFVYRVGETVHPDSYDDDPRVECTHGIHFFLTKEEAKRW